MENNKISKNQAAAERRAYFALKDKVVEFEKTNYDKIVFFKGTKGHFVACDHSGLMFYHLVLPKIKATLGWHRDNDHNRSVERFRYGYVSIMNLEKYISLTTALSFIEDEPNQNENRLVFKLKTPITEEQIQEFAHAEEIKRQALIDTIATNPWSMPKTFVALRNLANEARVLVNSHCDLNDRRFATSRIADLSHDAFDAFIKGCRHRDVYDEKMQETLDNASQINIELLYAESANIWSIYECSRLARAASEVATHLITERNKLKKQQAAQIKSKQEK